MTSLKNRAVLPYWRNQSVYIIGGGTSLKTFDWDLLKDKLTIGCNSAYLHGSDICKVLLFGDVNWWCEFGEEVSRIYDGIVYSIAVPNKVKIPDTVIKLQRKARGLYYTHLGWNGSTGAAATNLALLLGATKVCLLGFDMFLGNDGKPNWHNQKLLDKPNSKIYNKFIEGFGHIKKELPNKFPNSEIINITNNSDLDLFPIVSVEEHFQCEQLSLT